MHDTGLEAGELFIKRYWRRGFSRILDVGSLNVNGTLRQFNPPRAEYVGLDIEEGDGVDVVLDEPGTEFPFENDSFDLVVSTSTFEHDQMFWFTFCEMLRVTKPSGFVYINAPSNGTYHAYPYDNWRFYPDSGLALIAWAKRQGFNPKLVESMILRRKQDIWNDFVLVVAVDEDSFKKPWKLVSDHFKDAMNIRRCDKKEVLNHTRPTEDMQIIERYRAEGES